MKSLFLLLPLVLFGSCTGTNPATGTLAGHVDIGPLTPVVQIGVPPPTPTPQMYAAYTIVVSAANGLVPVAYASINAQGDYSVSLSPGVYRVTLSTSGFSRASNLPATVTITPGAVTTLDISIDTGIR